MPPAPRGEAISYRAQARAGIQGHESRTNYRRGRGVRLQDSSRHPQTAVQHLIRTEATVPREASTWRRKVVLSATGILLHLYPREFRERFGFDLEADFAQMIATGGRAYAWSRAMTDVRRALPLTTTDAIAERARANRVGPIVPPTSARRKSPGRGAERALARTMCGGSVACVSWSITWRNLKPSTSVWDAVAGLRSTGVRAGPRRAILGYVQTHRMCGATED